MDLINYDSLWKCYIKCVANFLVFIRLRNLKEISYSIGKFLFKLNYLFFNDELFCQMKS